MITKTPLDKYRNFELEEKLNFSWDEYNTLGIWATSKWAFNNPDANQYVLDTQKRQKLDVAFDEDLKAKQAEVKAEKKSLADDKLEQAKLQREAAHELHCKYCGSTNLQLAGDNRKKFSAGKSVIGGATLGFLAGPAGMVLGAGGGFAGKKGRKNQFVCINCGKTTEVRK